MRKTTRFALISATIASFLAPAGIHGSFAAANPPRVLEIATPSGEKFPISEIRQEISDRAERIAEKRYTKIRKKRAESSRKRAIRKISTPAGGGLSARFGETSRYWSVRHTGIDFDANYGTSVLNVMKGEVIYTGYAGAYGYLVVVRTVRGGDIWYAHLSSIKVNRGQLVGSGQRLGYVGSTGNSTGSHLHLEVRKNDYPVDPAEFLWGKHKGKIKKMKIPAWAYGDGIQHLNDL